MTTLNLPNIRWKKSSRSSSQGQCVEVAALTDARWRKSSRSSGQSNCVEVAATLPAAVAVRDSKDPEGPALAVSPTSWSGFLTALGTGSLHA